MLSSADHRRADLQCRMRVGRHHQFHPQRYGGLLCESLPKLYGCHRHGFLELVCYCTVLYLQPQLGGLQVTKTVVWCLIGLLWSSAFFFSSGAYAFIKGGVVWTDGITCVELKVADMLYLLYHRYLDLTSRDFFSIAVATYACRRLSVHSVRPGFVLVDKNASRWLLVRVHSQQSILWVSVENHFSWLPIL